MERGKGGWRMMLRVDRRFVHDGHGHAEDESFVPEDGVSLSPAPKGPGMARAWMREGLRTRRWTRPGPRGRRFPQRKWTKPPRLLVDEWGEKGERGIQP